MRSHAIFLSWLVGVLAWQAESLNAGWTRQVVNPSMNSSSRYHSLAIDNSGIPHMAYLDERFFGQGNSNILYARWSGTAWIIQTIGNAVAGSGLSLVLDTGGRPHVSYMSDFATQPPNTPRAGVKYAKWNGSSWIIQEVDRDVYPSDRISLVLDSNEIPHIAYYSISGDLKYAKWTGVAWSTQTVDSGPDYVGDRPSMILDSQGYPVISYDDKTNLNLKLARWNGASWNIETVDRAGDKGAFSSVQLDQDEPVISYVGTTGLRLAKHRSSGWSLQTVDSDQIREGLTSLKIVQNGGGPAKAYIAYKSEYDVKLASADFSDPFSSAWTIQTVGLGEGTFPEVSGHGVSLSLDSSGRLSMAYNARVTSDTIYAVQVNDPSHVVASSRTATSITWQWRDNADNEIGYRVRRFFDDSPPLSSDLPAGTTYWTQGGLQSNSIQLVYVEALHWSGAVKSTEARTFTLANPPSDIVLSGMTSGNIFISWSPNGNALGTEYMIHISSPTGYSFRVNTTTAALPVPIKDAIYSVEIHSINNDGIFSTEKATKNILHQTLDPNQTTHLNLTAQGRSVDVRVPAGAFVQAGTGLWVSVPAQLPLGNHGSALQRTGIAVDVHLDPEVQPLREVSLTIHYTDAEAAGWDESRFVIARYDEFYKAWIPLKSTPNPAGNAVTAHTNHFSTFQIMAATVVENVSQVRAYPSPLQPHLNSQMTFDNLPEAAQVRIHSFSGEHVRTLPAGSSGIVQWDGRDESGEPVASGVYLVFVDSPVGKKTIKVMVQR